MRIKHFFGLAVIAAMTASCSSNNDLVVGGGNGSGENESGVSYASITIDLPTTSGTRAANDKFDDGTASEYAVNDATLVIFEKGTATSEKDYKFVEAVPLGNLEPWKNVTPANKGITTEATITAQLSSAKVDKVGGKYYALVILNNETATGNKITLPSTSTETTYGTWNVATNTTNITDYAKGFYMANAPQFTTANVEPTTLVSIKGIYSTKEEAQSKAATTVHVERGLAKVTVGTGSSTNNYFATTGAKATGTNYSSDNVKITNWALDVLNKKSFPVHITSGLSKDYTDVWKNELNKSDRFVSASTSFKRVYWGVDPNYSNTDLNDPTKEADRTTNFTYIKKEDISSNATDVAYCLENTFNLDNMKQGQTTRVVFKATYTPNGFTAGSTFFKIGNHTELWSKSNLVAQIKTKAQEVLSEADADKITVVLDAESNDVEKTAGTKTLTKANVKHNDAEVTDDQINKINVKLGLKAATSTDPIVGITTYVNGESYYIARIKHFGDDLTPWNAGEANYGTDNEKYLGRYGVLRNNWYDLTVNSISGPGYPDVPEVKPNTPDDEDTKFINVSVKILDWAKRSQSWDL